MATFIKGDAIPNAWQYSLEKKNADGTYESIATQIATGEVFAALRGHYTDDGTPVAESDHLRTGALAVRILANYEGENTCVKTLEPTDYYSAVFVYSEKEPDIYTATVFKGGLHYDELMEAGTSAEKIRELAEGFGANYVIFVTSVPTVDTSVAVRLSTDINFCLDDYKDKFDIGTNYLVVRALAPLGPVDTDGDGNADTQYENSEYGGDKDGNPLEYDVVESTGEELAYTLRNGYYNTNVSTLPTSNPLTDMSNYVSTNMITRDQLPNGSKIICAEGWIYRPNGWESETSTSVGAARPNLVPAGTVVVDDSWWIGRNGTTEFNVRIFCISKAKADDPSAVDSTTSIDATTNEAEIKAAFRIVLPA